ncbi:hypothetical protein EST38_g13025 [Candolleomyces aberdarensis]|uniref:Cytochrome P450 n=1 Tax=Candolleomyces aberdarensis TaxID=2316362 RepID=A0A4Q2D3A4_9AGAR|nr:hypothetical protein EST38_g13025 [Candolleomyces aberdarensis]
MSFDTLGLLRTFPIFLGTWFAWRLLRWSTRKSPFAIIDGPVAESWLFGDFRKVFGINARKYHDAIAQKYGRVLRFTGFFNTPLLYVYDPKALYHILVKDQSVYEETDDFIMTNTIVFGKGLLSTLGDHHRKQRKLLNPVFSIAHMREMTPIFYDVVHKLRNSLMLQVSQGEKEIEMLSWMSRTALELIGQSGFGYSFDSLEEGAIEHQLATSMKNYTGALNGGLLVVVRMICLPWVYNLGTPGFRRAFVDWCPWGELQRARDIIDVMHQTSVEILEATKKSLKEGGETKSRIGGGKDIMSILVKANMEASEEDRLPESEILAQISTLTFAAMDTTSNALSSILHVLSVHPEAQEKLRQEIRAARKEHGGDLNYDRLTTLPYLEAVCRETLRLYAPVPFMNRETRKDVILPFSRPITTTDGKTLDEVFVPKDTQLFISLLHCNTDPDLWGPDAAEWKPERWLSPLPDTVMGAKIPGVYSNLMTFLAGSRACIGFKFSQLEMKVVLCLLLETFKFAPSGKKIIWQWSGIVQPTTEEAHSEKGDKALQLPLKVSLAG